MSSRVIQTATAAGTAHSDSTTEASIARKIFAANELKPGQVWQFDCALRATATNSTDTLTVAVRFGSSATVTSNTACATSAAVDVANDDLSIVRGFLHVHSATRAVLTILMSDCDAEGTMAAEQYVEILTIAADTAYYLDVTADWSVASSGNSVQAEAFAVLCAA